MYALEYYKAIERPEPIFTLGSHVTIRTRYGNHIIPGTIIKIARVWMEVRYEGGNSVNPQIERFHMENLTSGVSNDRLIIPEIEEFNALFAKAQMKLEDNLVHLGTHKLRDPKIVFYLADALDDFYAPVPEKE